MGREYFTCSNCQTQLSSDDFDTGSAIQVGDKIACGQCVNEMIAPYSLKDQDAILTMIRMAKARAAAAPPPAPAPTPPPIRAESGTRLRLATVSRPPGAMTGTRSSGHGRHVGLITFLIFFTFILALASLYFWVGGWERTEPPVAVAPPVALPPPAPVRPARTDSEPPALAPARNVLNRAREEAARSALERAREAGRAVPANYARLIDLYKKAVAEAEGTSLAPEAQKEFEELKKREKDIIQSELTVLDAEARGAIEKEEFRRAIEVYEKARDSHGSSTWIEAIMGRIRDVSAKDVWKVYIPLRDKAIAARDRKAQDEVQVIRDRVARWSLPQFANDLERILGGPGTDSATPTPAPAAADARPLTAEGKAYQRLCQEALRLAQSRDFDGAAAALEKAGAGLKEPEVRQEAQVDLEGLHEAAALFREILQTLSSWPKGDKIPLEYLDENGNPERGNDPLVRVDRASVEVMRGGEPYFIELGEISARSLIALLKKKPDSPRAAAMLCLLEGDAPSARVLLDGPSDKIPWKYWANAAKLAEARSNPTSDPAKRELAARRLYFAAERDRRQVRTRGAAIEKYRSLLNDYADTAFVQRRRSQISQQRDSAKEFVFLADDFGTSGVFRPSKAKFGPCLTSEADLSSPAARTNYVEFQFYAFPDPPTRCWVYVGGCCAETFTFFYQATDLTFPHPETKQLLAVEPGSGVSLPVNHSITFLKKKHDLHGGPKEPRQWNWVSLPLPKYTNAGLKTVRILTEQKGFSVAVAVVSTTRQNPPVESELKAWYKPAPAELPAETQTLPAGNPITSAVAAPEPRDPTLVGHWKLDDTGATAIDATGNDNTGILVNEPQRTQGKMGGAIAFDGKDRYVNIPNSASLEKLQDQNFTVAAWFRPHSKPAGTGDANDSAYAIVVKGGPPEGLRYGNDQRFTLEHCLGAAGTVTVTTAGVYAPGSFYHVAGVVSRTEGALRIYVNGKQDGQTNFPSGSAARDFGTETWKLGIASPTALSRRWSADGTIDDVRLYNRALGPSDVRALSGSPSGPPVAVVLSSPAPNDHFDALGTVTLTAHVTGAERVAKVEFLQGLYVLGSCSASPYVYSWHKAPVGVYSLSARAIDRSGGMVLSTPISIRVGKPEFYRGLKLGGSAGLTLDGQAWEGKEARNVVFKGQAGEAADLALDPPVDDVHSTLLRSWIAGKDAPVVTINPAPGGAYQIYVYVVSTGDQTYDLSIKGKTCLNAHPSGPSGRWEKLGPFVIDVSDGVIDVTAIGGKANFCGLELWRLPR
jgi:hypothetical protein